MLHHDLLSPLLLHKSKHINKFFKFSSLWPTGTSILPLIYYHCFSCCSEQQDYHYCHLCSDTVIALCSTCTNDDTTGILLPLPICSPVYHSRHYLAHGFYQTNKYYLVNHQDTTLHLSYTRQTSSSATVTTTWCVVLLTPQQPLCYHSTITFLIACVLMSTCSAGFEQKRQ